MAQPGRQRRPPRPTAATAAAAPYPQARSPARHTMPRRQQGQPSPDLMARMAAVLRAIPPAFPSGVTGSSAQPAAAASPPDPRRRRSLSNATHAAWQQELGAVEQSMQQLGVGRTRSEPVAPQRAAASPLPAPPPAPRTSGRPPLPASPAAQAGQQPRPATASSSPLAGRKPGGDSPGCSRRLLRSMRHRAQLSPSAARPRRHPATPPSPSRRQSGAGGAEASPRNTPFVVSPTASPGLPPLLAAAGSTPPPASPGRPSSQAATPPPAAQQPSPQLTSAAAVPMNAAAAAPPAPAAAAAATAATMGYAPEAPVSSDDAAPNDALPPLEQLLSSLPRRLQADLLSLLRRQHDYVGARRQERQRALRRLQRRMGKLEEQWQRLLQSGSAAAGKRHALRLLHRLSAAPHRSRSEPFAGAVAAGEAIVPPLALEASEPTLGGECLLEATLRLPSPSSQRARPQQQAAGRPGTPSALLSADGDSGSGSGSAASRVPSLRAGAWSPPPATPRLPLWKETSSPWERFGGQLQAPLSPGAVEPAAGQAAAIGLHHGASTPPAAGSSQHRQQEQATSTPRPATALERLKQSHLYSPLPSRRSSFTHGAAAGEPPADATVQVASTAAQRPAERKAQAAVAAAARPLTTPPRPGPSPGGLLELRGRAIQAAAGAAAAEGTAAGGGAGGALVALKQRRKAGQLAAAAAARPTTAPC